MRIRFTISLLILLCTASICAVVTRRYTIILRSNTGTITLWDGKITKIFGFARTLSAEPTLPATTIYADEGDTVIILAKSISQGDHHTIHLHGLDVDTRNDGDPATSFWLEHAQDTTYTFVAHHAGTYLYHCHAADVVHVQMGMYGLVVVRAKDGVKTAWTNGPAFDKEYEWLTSELDKSWHDTVPKHDPNVDTVHLPLYRPEYFLLNGRSHQQISEDTTQTIHGVVSERILIRIGNIGFHNNTVVFPSSLSAVVIASDGRPLPNQLRTDSVFISPGERYDVLLEPRFVTTDSVRIEYSNMNTHQVGGVEFVSVTIVPSMSVQEYIRSVSVDLNPNPVAGNLSVIARNGKKIKKVEIVDWRGVRINSTIVNVSEHIVVTLGLLESGRYTALITFDDGAIISKGFVKVK